MSRYATILMEKKDKKTGKGVTLYEGDDIMNDQPITLRMDKITLRMDKKLHAELKKEAATAHRSLNGHIIHLLTNRNKR